MGKKKIRMGWLAIALLMAGLSVWAGESGGDQAPIIVILDASGSMWGKLEDKSKIEIAKESLSDIIQGLPAGSPVGLMAYGHRSKSDCADVELLQPIAPLDQAKLSSAIKALSPKGMTPITAAIKQAAALVQATGREGTVILVSDGQETCKADPCQLVKDLKASGVKFVMHVVGFDVSAKEREQLECLAREGGGRYYSAKNAGEFKLAAQAVTETKPAPKTPPAGEGKVWLDEPAVAIAGTGLSVHFEADARFHQHAWIGIVPSGAPHGQVNVNDQPVLTYEYILGRTKGDMTLTAPTQPGSYDARMHDTNQPDGREVASATFTVKSVAAAITLDKSEFATGEPITVHFSLPAALGPRAWAGIVPSDVEHGKESINNEHDVGYQYLDQKPSGTLTLQAPPQPGQYDVRLNDSSGGSEIGSVGFTARLAKGELTLPRKEFKPGEKIPVRFKVDVKLGPRAWIGVVASTTPHGTENDGAAAQIEYQYLGEKTEGELTFNAPKESGAYDFRLYDCKGGNELASVTLTVQ